MLMERLTSGNGPPRPDTQACACAQDSSNARTCALKWSRSISQDSEQVVSIMHSAQTRQPCALFPVRLDHVSRRFQAVERNDSMLDMISQESIEFDVILPVMQQVSSDAARLVACHAFSCKSTDSKRGPAPKLTGLEYSKHDQYMKLSGIRLSSTYMPGNSAANKRSRPYRSALPVQEGAPISDNV